MSLIFASMCVKCKSDLFSLPLEGDVEFMHGPDLHSQVSFQLPQDRGLYFQPGEVAEHFIISTEKFPEEASVSRVGCPDALDLVGKHNR